MSTRGFFSTLIALFLSSLIGINPVAAADDEDDFPHTDGTKCRMDCKKNPDDPGHFALFETTSICENKPGHWSCDVMDEATWNACYMEGKGTNVAGLCYDLSPLVPPEP